MRRSIHLSIEENARLHKIHKEKHKRLCAYQKVLRLRWNKYEEMVERYFHILGIRYQTQKGVLDGDWNDFCIADFYIPGVRKTIVEVDGEYHDLPGQIKRDKQKDAFYRSRGFRVCRVNYRQLLDMRSPYDFLKLLDKAT